MYNDHVAAFWIHIWKMCVSHNWTIKEYGPMACAHCVRYVGVEAGLIDPIEYDVFGG